MQYYFGLLVLLVFLIRTAVVFIKDIKFGKQKLDSDKLKKKKLALKIVIVGIVIEVVILSYSVYSEIRRSCKYLPGEILKNENVLGFKKIVPLKDFEEVYRLAVEMKDNTIIQFDYVRYDYFGNITFYDIIAINEYEFSMFTYDKQTSRIKYIALSHMFEKSIKRYLDTYNINTVLNNYEEIKKASDKIMEFSDDEISLLFDLYETKSDASDWIKKIDKNYLLETKESITGCYKYRLKEGDLDVY